MFDAAVQAERRWQISLKRHAPGEYCGACPLPGCSSDDDGFIVFERGNYYCRACNTRGWVDENEPRQIDPTEMRLRKLEIEQHRARQERKEMERRLTAVEKMARCQENQVHIAYHRNLIQNDDAFMYWINQGMNADTIAEYKLGYCSHCPTASNRSASYTIPVINGGKLENIRHRLIVPDGGKYRPHVAGLTVQLFNQDQIQQANGRIVVTEGEKKSIIAQQTGFANVGILGKRSFRPEWLESLEGIERVYVALDPDALESAQRLAAMFGGRGYVVNLPCKLDDMIVQYGADHDDVEGFIKLARPCNAKSN